MKDVIDTAKEIFSQQDVMMVWFIQPQQCLMQTMIVALTATRPSGDTSSFATKRRSGPARCAALLTYYAVTGCDTVSSFAGKGKKSAFETWNACSDATTGFAAIALGDLGIGLPLPEKFVVAMYDVSTE
ncbi:hypothetical protein FQA39_LY12384 [Lamprigera yunnana]|nr:hypothetical protein FQA39_LY12384 [Lamprigera yunnana]